MGLAGVDSSYLCVAGFLCAQVDTNLSRVVQFLLHCGFPSLCDAGRFLCHNFVKGGSKVCKLILVKVFGVLGHLMHFGYLGLSYLAVGVI